MASTMIDEDKLLALLDVPVTLANAKSLQTGAYLLMLDAYDRKVTREQFKAYCANALNVYDRVGRLSMVTNMKQFLLDTGGITVADLMAAEAGCEDLVKQSAAECVKLANLLKQCPNDEDRVQ